MCRSGTLHLVGLGMGLCDVTVKGFDILNACAPHTYVDETTRLILNAMGSHSEGLTYEVDISVVTRLKTLLNLDTAGVTPDTCGAALAMARGGADVAVAVWGDPLVFTDYSDLLQAAVGEQVNIAVVHNASLLNTIASCGLHLYTFGETVQFPRPDQSIDGSAKQLLVKDKDSFFNRITRNHNAGWHTLCLLHCTASSTASCSSLVMQCWTPADACRLLLSLLSESGETSGPTSGDPSSESSRLTSSCECVTVTGFGGALKLRRGPLAALAQEHSPAVAPVSALIITGLLHPMERDCLSLLAEDCQEVQ